MTQQELLQTIAQAAAEGWKVLDDGVEIEHFRKDIHCDDTP